ncbi:MAG: disulfide bond formation protein B, partial [Rubrivivax sp.]|nr:disulfide bond formation protein B [Rubrivivax sp.]
MSEERAAAQDGKGRNATFWAPLFLAWLLALLATAGALFLGEVMGKTPCVLCWYQRIAMFPLVLVLGMGLFASDARSARYALPLAGVGWGIAAYHLLVF